MKKLRNLVAPVFDMFELEEPDRDFKDFNRHYDEEIWRGRASLLELPELPQEGGAGGNADDTGDAIDTYHEKHRGDTLITGPSDVTGKGSKPHA